jgi:hypothetical protein
MGEVDVAHLTTALIPTINDSCQDTITRKSGLNNFGQVSSSCTNIILYLGLKAFNIAGYYGTCL